MLMLRSITTALNLKIKQEKLLLKFSSSFFLLGQSQVWYFSSTPYADNGIVKTKTLFVGIVTNTGIRVYSRRIGLY